LQAPTPGCGLGFADWRAAPRQAAYYEEELAERGGEVESFPLGPNFQSEQPGDIVYRSVLQWVRNHVAVRHTIGSRETSSNPRPSSAWMVAARRSIESTGWRALSYKLHIGQASHPSKALA
jgi:hypothetical protein